MASITTAVGFGSILVSDHPGLRSMGILAVTGIGCLLAAAVVFFPCVLTLLERIERRKSRRGQMRGTSAPGDF